MSIHSDLMGLATDLLVAVQGDQGAAAPVLYCPPRQPALVWDGSSIGSERGGFQTKENGDVLKVTRLTVQGPTARLVRGGVTELERDAIITVGGKEWSIDLAESHWAPTTVRLGLVRRPITRHDEAQQNGTV